MRPEMQAKFPLSRDIVMFNHASYGLATNRALKNSERIRHQLENDPNHNLGSALLEQLASSCRAAESAGLIPPGSALTCNATEAVASVERFLPLTSDSRVLILSTEYSSVKQGWAVRCKEIGARDIVVDIDVPVDSPRAVIAALDDQVRGKIWAIQVSWITSDHAVLTPMTSIAAWARQRGALVLVDAAHVPGHLNLTDDSAHVDVLFGTLHKWLPVPRSVGFLWTSPALRDRIRPAEVSLRWGDESFVDRFSWPGTFDPTSRLCLPDAIAEWSEWKENGLLGRCRELADHACAELMTVGAIPTAKGELVPPRLRSYLLPGVSQAELRAALLERNVRAWTGSASGAAILRLATHIYNDEDDVDIVVNVVRRLLAS